MAVFLAGLMVAVDLLSSIIVVLAARGILRRNAVAGIRTRRTRLSESAWERGHQAAMLPVLLGAGVSVAFAIAVVVTPQAPAAAVASLLTLCVLAMLGGGAWGVVRAGKATAP